MALATTWAEARKRIIAQSIDKNKYLVYPLIIDGVEGYAEFIERTVSTTTQGYAMTLGACQGQISELELLGVFEAANKNTTGSFNLDSAACGSYTFTQTEETKTTHRGTFKEGSPPEEGA